MKAFKHDFERKNPEKAKQLQEALLSASERTAKQALREIDVLSKRQQAGDKTVGRDWDKMVTSLGKQPEVMRSLQQLDRQVYSSVKEHQHKLEKAHDRDRGEIER